MVAAHSSRVLVHLLDGYTDVIITEWLADNILVGTKNK